MSPLRSVQVTAPIQPPPSSGENISDKGPQSFFATPFFHWDASQYSLILQPHFWIYWAVTIPLTFITLIVYFLLSSLKTIKENEEDEMTIRGKRQNAFSVGPQRRSRRARLLGLDLLARNKDQKLP
jgi:hypothetical protein